MCILPVYNILYITRIQHFIYGIGGLGVACWPLVPKFEGSNPAKAVGFLRAKKILSTPSFGGEVKPSVPKIPKWRRNRHFDKITGQHSRPQFHIPPLGSLASWHLVAKVGTSKSGGKQWQTTPKTLPRMQRTRAIPVAWLRSGLCPNRPKGWILIIITTFYISTVYNILYITRIQYFTYYPYKIFYILPV